MRARPLTSSRPPERMRILYHTSLSPYCRKIRLALREKQLDFELTQENVWERRMKFFALNPAGEVPVLIEPNGEVISGNHAISEYLEEAYTDTPLLSGTALQKAEIRRLVDWFDNKFDHEVTKNIIFEKVFRKLQGYGEPNSEAIRAGKNNILYHLDYIGYLTEARQWLAGDSLTLADISAAAHISALDYLGDIPWHHNLKAREWYALMKSRPSFRYILSDRISGFVPPPYYENPDF